MATCLHNGTEISERCQALCLCRLFFHECGYLIPPFSGLIFLGVPHFQRHVTTVEVKQTIEFLLKYRNKEAKRNYQTTSDVPDLIELCREFERLNLNIPTISVYESETAVYQTSLFARFLHKTQSQVVRSAYNLFDGAASNNFF